MDSIVLYTEEIDDLQEAVQDIFEQAEDFPLKKNSLAILFAEEETDYPALYQFLSEKWKFPVIGCTAMAMLLGKQGYCGTGISVLLLTADDCEFAAGMTGELNKENYESRITETMQELKKGLSSDIKLVISYGGMVTDERNVATISLRLLIKPAAAFPCSAVWRQTGSTLTGSACSVTGKQIRAAR